MSFDLSAPLDTSSYDSFSTDPNFAQSSADFNSLLAGSSSLFTPTLSDTSSSLNFFNTSLPPSNSLLSGTQFSSAFNTTVPPVTSSTTSTSPTLSGIFGSIANFIGGVGKVSQTVAQQQTQAQLNAITGNNALVNAQLSGALNATKTQAQILNTQNLTNWMPLLLIGGGLVVVVLLMRSGKSSQTA